MREVRHYPSVGLRVLFAVVALGVAASAAAAPRCVLGELFSSDG